MVEGGGLYFFKSFQKILIPGRKLVKYELLTPSELGEILFENSDQKVAKNVPNLLQNPGNIIQNDEMLSKGKHIIYVFLKTHFSSLFWGVTIPGILRKRNPENQTFLEKYN